MPISATDRLGKRGVAQRVVELIGAFQTTPKLVLCWLRYENKMVAHLAAEAKRLRLS
jgi:hypothetical protein